MKISLKGARIEKGLTQQQAALEMHVSKATIANWEKGRTFPDGNQLMDLCSVYSISVADIFLPERLAKSEKEKPSKVS